MKKTKKILMTTSLCTLAICIILLIGAIFGMETFKGTLLKVLESCATIAIAGFFSINALTMTRKNKTLGYVCLSLLGLLSLCMLIIIWASVKAGTFTKLVYILLIATVLFNIIVTLNLNLDKRFFALQIITYVLIFAIDVILTLVIFGSNILKGSVLKLFIAGCIIVFGLMCALAILSKKTDKEEPPKEDIASLKKRIAELEAENKALKEQISNMEK